MTSSLCYPLGQNSSHHKESFICFSSFPFFQKIISVTKKNNQVLRRQNKHFSTRWLNKSWQQTKNKKQQKKQETSFSSQAPQLKMDVPTDLCFASARACRAPGLHTPVINLFSMVKKAITPFAGVMPLSIPQCWAQWPNDRPGSPVHPPVCSRSLQATRHSLLHFTWDSLPWDSWFDTFHRCGLSLSHSLSVP